MTKDESLDWLYRLRSEIYVYMPKEWLVPMNNALDDAIKSFEKQPCEDAVSREFIEITTHYPPSETCIYPEYKGKPYYSIKYRENGKTIVGYGTYNLEVLSRYLKEYFLPSVTVRQTEDDPYQTDMDEAREQYVPMRDAKGISCTECKYFKVTQEPLRGTGGLIDLGQARCEKHDLIKDFAHHGQFKNLKPCKFYEDFKE